MSTPCAGICLISALFACRKAWCGFPVRACVRQHYACVRAFVSVHVSPLPEACMPPSGFSVCVRACTVCVLDVRAHARMRVTQVHAHDVSLRRSPMRLRLGKKQTHSIETEHTFYREETFSRENNL